MSPLKALWTIRIGEKSRGIHLTCPSVCVCVCPVHSSRTNKKKKNKTRFRFFYCSIPIYQHLQKKKKKHKTFDHLFILWVLRIFSSNEIRHHFLPLVPGLIHLFCFHTKYHQNWNMEIWILQFIYLFFFHFIIYLNLNQHT